jgi:hypothetical protein
LGYGVLWRLSPMQVHVGSAVLAAAAARLACAASPAATLASPGPIAPRAVAYWRSCRRCRRDVRDARGHWSAAWVDLSQQSRNRLASTQPSRRPRHDLAF